MSCAGELVMVDIEGKVLADGEANFLRARKIRAVCLFRKNLGSENEVRQLTRDLRAVLGERALIALDQEGGSVIRASFLPQPPAAMALGAADDVALAEAVGEAVARGIRSLGCNWNFAPVLDVNNNPANPVIAGRSFAADPHAVARLGGAWLRGALRAGVAGCVKHFPGHGDTHVDSHRDLPRVDKSRTELEALEFLPFRSLLRQAPAMMTAHIIYSQLDAEYPATLSRRILGDLLRGEWGYDGVVITDSLVMKAIADGYGHERAAVLALQAGADMVLALGSCVEQAAAVDAIAAAIDRGELAAAQMEQSARRLDSLALCYPVQPSEYSEPQRAADDRLMRRAWAAGLTAVRAPRAPSLDQPLRVYTQHSVPSDGISEAGPRSEQVAKLFANFRDAEVVLLDDLQHVDQARLPKDQRLAVLVSNHRQRYTDGKDPWRPDLHLVLWNPFQTLDIAAPTVVTWGFADGALDAMQAWLEGRGGAPGKAPVSLC